MASTKSKSVPELGFFGTLKASFYSPEFYESIEKQPKKKTVRYFALLTFFYTILLGASLVMVIRDMDLNPKMVGQNLSDVYPENLTISIKEGHATTNVDQPFFIELPESWKFFTKDTSVTHLAVIDTVTEFGVPQFKDYQSLAWLTGDSLYYVDKNGVSGAPLTGVKDVEITKSLVGEVAQKITEAFTKLLPAFIGFGAVAGFLGLLAWHALYVLFLALFISIIRRGLKLPSTFKLSYKTGIYALTYTYTVLAIMLGINAWTPWHFVAFPFMVSLITLAGVGLNLKNVKR